MAGGEHEVTWRSSGNVTGWDRGELECWKATTVGEVKACIKRARRERKSLYPISTGLNWGYGSAAPPQPGAVLLDLSGMNQILNKQAIKSKQGASHTVAVIEPGVTQRDLYEFLREFRPDLSFNVTGSSLDTSILGNALDRGVGYFGPRREDVFGLEVVTGNGEELQTGFRHLGEESPLAHSHPYGLGPMLDGLFFQSNFGVVTSACLKLTPRPERSVAVSLSLRDTSNLAQFLDGLADLKRRGVITGVTHIGERERTRASLMSGISQYLESHGVDAVGREAQAQKALAIVAPHEWTSLGGIAGSKDQVKAAVAEVKRALKHLARVTVVSEARLGTVYRLAHALRWFPPARWVAAGLNAAMALQGLADGRPTDGPIDNLLWAHGQSQMAAKNLDASDCGLIFINPALPMDGAAVVRIVNGMQAVARAEPFGHVLHITLNIETATSMVAVANLRFDRGEAGAAEKAQACARAIWKYLRSEKLQVYRARADMMEDIVDASNPFWRTAWALKSVFDRDNLIAPGRYNLAEAPVAGEVDPDPPKSV